MKKKWKRFLLSVGVLFTAAALLSFPQEAAKGAGKGLGYCTDILIPSLFPFMVLSVFVVKSGLASALGRFAAPLCERLFRLPGSAAAAIVMGAIGGYPVGARAAASLVQEGELTREQGARMLCFCINAGPAFLISVVGAGLLRCTQAGLLLLASQLSACLLLGVLSAIGAPRPSHTRRAGAKPSPAAQAFILSAADASRSMLGMCAFVILFAAALALLRPLFPGTAAGVLLSGILEVTGGCFDAAKSGAPLWYFAFVTGWGGLCVHFQALSFSPELHPGLSRFFCFRMLHGIIAAVFAMLYGRLFPHALPAFSNTSMHLQAGFASAVPACAALLFLCVLLLLEVRPLQKEN